MKTLATLLDQVLEHTSFDIERIRLPIGHSPITPAESPETTISPTQLREIVNRGRLSASERQALEFLRPRTPKYLVTKLAERLHELLFNHMAPGSNLIRHVFPVFDSQPRVTQINQGGLSKEEYVSTMNDFVKKE